MTEKSNTEEKVSYDENLGIDFNFDENIKSEIEDDKEVLSGDVNKPLNEQVLPTESKDVDVDINKILEEETESSGLADISKGKKEPEDKKKIVNKTDEPQIDNDKSQIDKGTSSSTVAFGRYLQEQGSFTFDEEAYKKNIKEKGEAKAFLELLENQASEKANNHIKNLDDYSKEYVEFRKSGFTKEEARNYVSERETVDNITDDTLSDNEDLQINVVRQVSKLRGMSDEEIDDNIDLLKDTDKLEGRAKTHLSVLQNYYKAVNEKRIEDEKANVKLQEDANKTYFEQLKEEIGKTDEYIQGKKVNKETKDKIYNLISTPIKLDKGGVTNGIWEKRSKDPKTFDKKLAYYIVTGLFDGNTKDIATDTRTKILSELEKNLNSNRNFNVGSPVMGNDEDKNLNSKLDEMKGFFE